MMNIEQIKEIINKEKKIVNEINSYSNYVKNAKDEQEKNMVESQIKRLKNSLKNINDELLTNLESLDIVKPLEAPMPKISPVISVKKESKDIGKWSPMEREILRRIKKKKEKIAEKKEKKPSAYAKLANSFFADKVKSFIKEKKLKSLEKDLIKSNLGYTPVTYVSILILTTILSVAAAFVIFLFFLFFNLGPNLPIITLAQDNLLDRLMKVIWILIIIPVITFLFMYIYPSLEGKSTERRINQELPFATIHMAAISGSMIEPVKIFNIIAKTKEYPFLEREFNKLLNVINVYGYDLVTALKSSALNSPSQKLAELFNGLATTITSGGNLYDFFDKRSQSMMFEYRLDQEKNTKAAETSMDIYISVVIAAPMILMLLLMMMRISGLGIALSTSMITLIVVGGVSLINFIFLIFLQIKQG
ncbi:type II secretion system F family protein [Candidatus Pacearchaeota archaeon]|nr:type II secretion system F family protein [Candidatus Pacearchaeota archaeon]